MPPHLRSVPSSAHAADAPSRLAAVARAITEPDLAPQAVGVVFAADQVELHVKDLGDDHPVEQLLGFRAPPGWDAFGLTVTGRSVPLPGSAASGPVPDDHPLVLTYLADRGGGSTAFIAVHGDEPIVIDEPSMGGAQGAVADLCWRVLGRPTPPPDVTVAHFWSTWWLDCIVSLALDDHAHPPEWELLAALHPAVTCLADLDRRLGDDPDRTLAALGSVVADTWSWTAVRTSPWAVERIAWMLPDDVLAWMDDGIFSRWAMARLPDLDDLRATVAELLPSQLVDRIDDAVRATERPR
jgi:hypothetical protein